MNLTKFYIDQHGCAKNQTDGEIISGFLSDAGFTLTSEASEADFIIINSCGFIESAKKESINSIYQIKENYPDAKIVLTGCLAERYAKDLSESIPELDGIFGNGNLSKIVDFMKSVLNGNKKVETFPQEGVCAGKRPALFNFAGSAFVKITEGCSNHCSFCAIPLIRGELRSRPADAIISEIKDLIKNGVYEINLIGQDLAAYGTGVKDLSVIDGDSKFSPLCRLLQKISSLDGDFLIRLLYIHPDHFNTDILDVMKNDHRFARYFDIPFQSGDTQIIHGMNRKGSKESYINLVKTIRNELPECMIRTTFLTGFPGETDEAAANTLDFLKIIEPDWSGCFPYSREEDTPAYNLKNRVSKKIAEKRAAVLEETQSQITQKRQAFFCGKEECVLIEELIELNPEVAEDSNEGLAIGRGWFQAPDVDGCVVVRYDLDDETAVEAIKPGAVIKVKILSSTGVDLDSRFICLEKSASTSSSIKYIQ